MTIRAAVVALGALALAGCGAANRAADPAPSGRLLRGGPAPALAALADGSLLVGLLRTGEIWRVPAHGVPRRPFPRLRVSVDGQRGLLSLAAVHGRIYAAWTTRARRLVVGRLRPHAAPVIVWRGVDTATLANGGHLAGAPDGRLAVGIGDRQTGSPEGRLLSLDPAGPATQRPRTLSTGWNNPFAFAFTPDGHLSVADNAPVPVPERLARGDTGGGPPGPVSILDRRPAPSGLAATA